MIGKTLKVDDYKFTYGQGTAYINIYGVFKYIKNGNKYAVYSYEGSNKLFYGAFFLRNKEAVIMTSKEDPKEIIEQFVDLLLNEKKDDNFEVVSLEEIESVQVIEEYTMNISIDVNKLYDLTIPKPLTDDESDEDKKTSSIAGFFFAIFVMVVIAFFFVNPEVIFGENEGYSCTKSYFHSELPASVNEVVSLTFSGKGKIISLDVTADYVFTDFDYYNEFKAKSYYYQYMKEGDTYKFIDENYTYRLFSETDTVDNFFLPTDESELISYYEGNNYTCKVVELDEE